MVGSSPDEITRERLEAEATLLDSVERETECEAITEREDTYEVIIDNGVQIKSENFSIGMYLDEKKLISKNSQLSVSHIEDTSSFGISPHNDAPAYLNLRRYLNCLDQEDTRLIGDIREHYIRFDTFTLTLFFYSYMKYLETLTMKNPTMRIQILIKLEKMKRLQITGKMKSLTPFCFKAR